MAAPAISERSLKKIVGFFGVIVDVYRSMFLALGARRDRLYGGNSRDQPFQEIAVCVKCITQLGGGSFRALVKEDHHVQSRAGNGLIREHGVVNREDVASQQSGAEP